MSRQSKAIPGLPSKAKDSLTRMGRDLRIARLRRGMTQKRLAEAMFVSVQTLQRLEKGDPSISLGIWMSCVFCLNRMDEIKNIMSPENDVYGNILEEQKRRIQRKARQIDQDPDDKEFEW